MKSSSPLATLLVVAAQSWRASAAVELQLNVSTLTTTVESDWTGVYYSDVAPLLLGNDGGTSTGGFHAWNLDDETPLSVADSVVAGRTKLLATAYGLAGSDWVFSIAQPDSILRAFSLPELTEAESAQIKVLGDWSALCSWKSKGGNNYVYLFGKGQAVQLLARKAGSTVELVEVQTFTVPFEASGCASSASASRMYLSTDDDKGVYFFDLAESVESPQISKLGEAEDDVTGLAVYASTRGSADYLFVAQESVIGVYDQSFELVGTLALVGLEDIEIQGLSIYQAPTEKYAEGALVYAIEADGDVAGFGVSSLENVFEQLGIASNTAYDPRGQDHCASLSPICKQCSGNGFCSKGSDACACFAGFAGSTCDQFQCTDNCSGHGECVGANECACDAGWGGLHCSFIVVEATYETEANGGDGDDPAIWISPEAPEKSRIITTTKSTAGAGLGVFDLTGKLLQTIYAGEPNNVDVIYNFQAGERTIDLAFAACRADDTLCLFEILSNGTLTEIPGGIQPTVDDYSVYGSCVYRSRTTGKQYLFVNEKSARYLQYELSSTANGTLETTLVRDFVGGSGGQVEGCVTDEDNGWIFLGEEPSALWRYDAEPDSEEPGVRVAYVGDGLLNADVEGVTLVPGKTADEGFVLVSTQGVSAYNIYRRAAPHAYVGTFTIARSADGQIDAVSNTDGIAAVGNALGADFPHGLVVVHDDSNELPGGGTSDESSFKLVSLESILGAEPLASLGLLDEVDAEWDPRAERA